MVEYATSASRTRGGSDSYRLTPFLFVESLDKPVKGSILSYMAKTHNLEGRMARCGMDCRVLPSSYDLAFFEYLGEGMERPNCSVGKCFYIETVHQAINPHTGRPGVTDHAFVPRVSGTDSYYCGCRGWD